MRKKMPAFDETETNNLYFRGKKEIPKTRDHNVGFMPQWMSKPAEPFTFEFNKNNKKVINLRDKGLPNHQKEQD